MALRESLFVRGVRLIAAAISVSAIMLLAVWIDDKFDLQPYYCIAAPIVVWLLTTESTRPLFRHRWFWQTSIVFVAASALAVAYLGLAPRGSRLSRWLIIMMAEGSVFLIALAVLRQRAGLDARGE